MNGAARCGGRLGLAVGLGLASAAAMAQATKPGTPEPGVTFSRDIAPVLVANCVGCHGPGGQAKAVERLDQSTFRKLMARGKTGPAIVPGKPQDSELVLRIKGESEGRKMPPGNDKDLAPETIAKIEEWIRAGARLDPGPGHTLDAPLTSYAATPESRKREELARLTPAQRDERLATFARQRWKKGSPDTTPEMTPSAHFALFSRLPKDRVEATLKLLEGQVATLRALLGQAGAPALNGPEKISIYVFNEPTPFVEFLRGNENREVERGTEAGANFGVEAPYLVAADPQNGREDPNQGKRPSASSRKKDEEPSGPSRSLAGLLAEQLGGAATSHVGKPPRWLSSGIGAYLGSRVEPASPYYRRLRALAAEQVQTGWMTKANEALGDQADEEAIRAVGFSLIEWMASSWAPRLPYFVRGMLAGQEKLDDQVGRIFGVNREPFLQTWGEWILQNYRRAR